MLGFCRFKVFNFFDLRHHTSTKRVPPYPLFVVVKLTLLTHNRKRSQATEARNLCCCNTLLTAYNQTARLDYPLREN